MRILALTALALTLAGCGAAKDTTHDQRAHVHTVAKSPSATTASDCWSTDGKISVQIFGAGARACAQWDRERSTASAPWRESQPPRGEEETACSLQNGSYVIRVVAEGTVTHASADSICGELAGRGWKQTRLND
jgi:hypothetical protein